ncbi:MAG: alpha/beta hydrolase [Gemmatimonadota bacterium]|jgi:pimeloyl-ACP methyl ester carboxylesterase|nr:alpha/beta hydrolase [Gemmatimonadota bacterium]
MSFAREFLKKTIPAAFAIAAGAFVTVSSAAQQVWPEVPPAEPPADWGPVSINLEEIQYPYPVHFLELNRFNEDMRMAYMDVPPTGTPNGQAVIVLHGMNFYGGAYGPTAAALSAAGFRVVLVDQIGYGKSSKPIVPYDLNFFVSNTKAVLDHLGIEKLAVVGHSMGGMVATRFAMVYPQTTTHLVLVNQIGLTDQRQSRPWRDIQASYETTLRTTTYRSILANHQSYYPTWYPPHLEYVRRQYGQTLSGDWPRMAMVRTLQQEILYSDPVVYDWQHIRTKSLVLSGAQDGLTPNFEELALNVARTLPNATHLLYPGIGHNPQIEIPDRFHADLIRFLQSDPNARAADWK